MTHKYCRYCAFCISGDTYYCTALDKELRNVKSVTSCSEFALSKMGDVDTGKHYIPRKHIPAYETGEQITFEGA